LGAMGSNPTTVGDIAISFSVACACFLTRTFTPFTLE
jgi:hypothetical protein